MNRFSCVVFASVVASALALNAQTQTVAPTPSAGPSTSTITVVGCVENAVADGSLGGTPLGTSATPADAPVVANAQPPVDGFLLTGARPGRSAVGTTGAAGDPPAPAATAGSADAAKDELKTYALEGDRNELAKHRGHRVEISGELAAPASSGANQPNDRGGDAFKTGVQRLRVQTLTMVAASCSEK